MKSALIPGLFLVCGALASAAWRTVELPCRVSKLEIASAVTSPLLRCVADELFTREAAFSAVNQKRHCAEPLYASWDAAPTLLFEIVVNQAFDRPGGKISSLGLSISSWLVRHRV